MAATGGWQVGDTVRRQAAEIARLKAELGEANEGWNVANGRIQDHVSTIATLRQEAATTRDRAIDECLESLAENYYSGHPAMRINALKSKPTPKLFTEAEVQERLTAELKHVRDELATTKDKALEIAARTAETVDIVEIYREHDGRVKTLPESPGVIIEGQQKQTAAAIRALKTEVPE